MAKLVVLSEGFKERACDLKAERTSIGRAEDNIFVIPEASVSGHHCEVLIRGTEVVVKDLNSTNGTFIDDNAVTESVLKPNQTLRLGLIELRLEGAPAIPVKRPEHTQVVPQGVKLNDFEQGTHPINMGANSPFRKKSNKVNVVFLWVGVGLALLVIVLLVIAHLKAGGPQL